MTHTGTAHKPDSFPGDVPQLAAPSPSVTDNAGRLPREHQIEAMAGLDELLATGRRAQLVMACGTGKTLVGRWYAERLRAAITVVVVPSLNLVAQTLREWRSVGGWSFEALITCSDATTADGIGERAADDGQEINPLHWERLRARVTTDASAVAERLVANAAAGPLVIFSTYHSAHVIAEATRASGVTVDFLVADEAHVLAGQPRQEFRVVIDDNRFRVRRRVFMTATAVNIDAADEAHQDSVDFPGVLVSMSDAELFGPVAYRLDFAEAISRGLLADYRVLIYETPGLKTRPDPLAALAAAAEHGVRSVLSFHSRVANARRFASAIDGHVLSDGRTVVARAVAGVDPTRQREMAIDLLAEARPDRLVVISSVRCLSAGVDIPAVDGVLFADPKHSDVDVIQSVGRSLRPSPGKRFGMVMVPVCVPAGLDDDTALSTGSFAAAWRILRGLRSMDGRLAAELEAFVRKPSRRGVADHTRLSRVSYDIASLRDPDGLHARVVDLLSPAWDLALRDLKAFVLENGHAWPAGRTQLGVWCERQRSAYRRGLLLAERASHLSALPGWVWSQAERRWLEQCAQVAELAAVAGGLDLGAAGVADTALTCPSHRSTANSVGRWCALQRQRGLRGDLDGQHRARLEQIPGWTWSALPADDARAVQLLGEYIAWKGHANPGVDVVEDGVALGKWLNGVRRRRAIGTLSQALSDELGIVCPGSSSVGALRWHRGATMWLVGLEALRRFVAREGHCIVPGSHVEDLADVSVPLYDWCTRQRHFHRHGQLVPSRVQLLDTVSGWRWECLPAPRVRRDIGATKHGTPSGYMKGCTCVPCTGANADRKRRLAQRIAAGEKLTEYVDAAAARTHLTALIGQGAAQKELARACGLNAKTLQKILGGHGRILAETQAVILAVDLASARAAMASGSCVDGGPTWELLDSMIGRGWTKSWIARELGSGASLQLRRSGITPTNAAKVAALAERLGDRVAPATPRNRALPALDVLLAAEVRQQVAEPGRRRTHLSVEPGYRVSQAVPRSRQGASGTGVIALADRAFDDQQSA